MSVRRLGQQVVIAKVPHHQPVRAQHKPCKPKEYLKQEGCMPGLVSLDPSPARARGLFLRANELLCDTGRTVAAVEEGQGLGL